MFVLMILRVLLANTVLSSKYESLTHIYSNYSGFPGFDHWIKYGPAYDENIFHVRERAVAQGRKVQMLEIGIQSGGSTRVWKRYFRGTLSYVGLDIDSMTKKFQSLAEGIRIEIGSQLDTAVLSKICSEYGPFDLVVDDGGHTNNMMITSLKSLWGCMKDGGVYAIEDLHALSMGHRYLGKKETSIFQLMSEWMKLRSPHPLKRQKLKAHPSLHLEKLVFYDSMLFLHYADHVTKLERVKKGKYWFSPNSRRHKIVSNLTLSDWCTKCCIGCFED